MQDHNVIRMDERTGEIRRKLPRPKGHEIMLAGIIKRKGRIGLVMLDGTEIAGKLSQFDSYTITLYPDQEEGPRTFYKHAIESFGPA